MPLRRTFFPSPLMPLFVSASGQCKNRRSPLGKRFHMLVACLLPDTALPCTHHDIESRLFLLLRPSLLLLVSVSPLKVTVRRHPSTWIQSAQALCLRKNSFRLDYLPFCCKRDVAPTLENGTELN